MRDDERPDRNHPDDADERFDDALDDLFGPDDEDEETHPEASRQQPQPPGGSSPPPHTYVPDVEHHNAEREHVFGPENAPPPPSYDTFEQPPGQTTTETWIPTSTPRKRRDWRKIACFGCLAAVGIPALCLAILVVIGLVSGGSDAEPTQLGVSVDNGTPTSIERSDASGNDGGLPEPFSTIMDGREPLTIEINGDTGYGLLDKPVPLTIPAILGDGWELRVNSVTEDANQIVDDANMFNNPPAEGRQFVIANITATNGTGAADTFDAGFRLRLASLSSGNVYTTFDTSDRCGVIPDAVAENAISPGEAVTGNVCWQVRSEDVESLVLYNESFSELDGAIWFELTSTLSAR